MTQAGSVQPEALNTLELEDSIEIPATIGEVYRRWSDFVHFPQFMANVEEVTPRGGARYHWVARIFGVKQEWDAEVTENDPRRSIAWRSVTGAYNAGTVTFMSLGEHRTLARVRFEYAPPGGKVGQALDQVMQTTRREVHEDLENFKKLYTGSATGVMGTQGTGASLTQADGGGIGRVFGPLAAPIAAGAAGGVASYIIGRRLRESKLYNAATSPVALPHAVGGWALIGAAGASVIGSATLRSRGQVADALFVGQWAPTLLGMGIFARMLGHRGVRTNLPTSVTSWTYFSACLGSIVGSAFLHLRGRREDGLFVGQWAPTFLNAALFTRLFTRLIAR